MNDHVAVLLVVILIGPSFAGCTDGGQQTPGERMEDLVDNAKQCDTDPNSGTPGKAPSSKSDTILSTVGYATGTDRTLLRWTPGDMNQHNATIAIERTGGGSPLTDTVSPVTDPSKASQILDGTDARWPDLTQTLIDAVDGTKTPAGANRTVETPADLVTFLHEHPRFAQVFAQRYYPVALVLGWAYLDTQGQDGATYDYTVKVQGGQTLGTVNGVRTDRVTPLDRPQQAHCISLEGRSPLRASSQAPWDALQQQQRLFHQKVYLGWDDAGGSGSQAWVNGYDVYRAPLPSDPGDDIQSLTDLEFQRVNEEVIQPNPTNVTPPSGSTDTSSEAMDFYHIDETPSPGTWVYRVAPRDILGHPRDPGRHSPQFSEPLVATSFDFQPPDPPNNASAVPGPSNDAVRVNWSHPNLTFTATGSQVGTQSAHIGGSSPPVPSGDITPTVPQVNITPLPEGTWSIDDDADLSHFAVYRARNASARPPTEGCTDETLCWVHVGNTTKGVLLDDTADRNVAYWYHVKAVDGSDAGNPSAPAGPMQASLVDRTPPEAPRLENNGSYRDDDLGNPEVPGDQQQQANWTYGPTLTVHPKAGDDTERTRVYCRFDGGNWTRIATEPTDDAGVAQVHTGDHYDPPTRVDARCRARSVDEQGNVGPPSGTTNVTFGGRTGSQDLPTPIAFSARHNDSQPADLALSRVGTLLPSRSASSSWPSPPTTPTVEGIRVNWSIPDAGNVDHLEVVRMNPEEGDEWVFRVDADRSSIVDPVTPAPGNVTEYKIRAIPDDPRSNATESQRVGAKNATSPTFADVRRPQRTIGDLPLRVGEPPNVDHAVGLDFPLYPESETSSNPGYFAVFRSVHRDGGYRQITPVGLTSQLYPIDPQAPGFNFTDHDVYRNYWYTVVQFDKRTGEPIRSSEPVQASNMVPARSEPHWSSAAFQSGRSVPNRGPCAGSGSPPDAGDVVTFANGFDVRVLGADGNGDGSGTATIQSDQGSKQLSLTLRGVHANADGVVCRGQALEDFPGVSYSTPAFETRIHQFVIGPNGTSALVDAEVQLPKTVSYYDGTASSRWVPFADLEVHQDGTISFSRTVQGDCTNPSVGFQLETAPTLVVPSGTVELTKEDLTLGSACTDYRPGDRSLADLDADLRDKTQAYRSLGFNPLHTNLGTANDGYLRPTLQASTPVTMDETGLTGSFGTSLGDPLRWVASAPSSFEVELTGSISVDVENSDIAGGDLNQGEIGFSHYKNSTGYQTAGPTRTSFQSLSLDPGGRAYGVVELPEPVRWRMLSTDPASWELLLGNVTYGTDPGRGLVSPHPDRSRNLTTLGQADLEPGLNIRSPETSLKWLCSGGSSFRSAMDAYVRRGGVSHAFRALLSGSQTHSFHGYDGGLSKWGRGFLDNHAVVDETVGSIDIPDPSNVSFTLDPAHLDEVGCVKGGSGFGDRVLDYWNLTTSIEGIEFREPDDGVPHDGDALLFAHGSHDVPHYDPQAPDGGTVPAQWAFLPDGRIERTNAYLDDPEHEVDGFPFLFEGLRLSDVNEPVDWSRSANIEPAPQQDATSEGFVELQGRMVTPYFGQVTSDAGEAPNLRIINGTDYLGFDRRPVVEKTWVDVADAELVWSYDLVYVHDDDSETGRFTAFESYQFVPLGRLFNALEKPKDVVDRGFSRVNRTVQQALDDVEETARKPFTEAKSTMSTARSTVLEEIDGANRTISEHIVQYFQRVRDKINRTDSPAELHREIEKEAFGSFAQQLSAVRATLEDVQDVRENQLQTAIRILVQAETALESLQSTTVDTHRMLRTVHDQLERAAKLLGPKLDTLPDIAGTKLDPGKLRSLQSSIRGALQDADGLESTFAQALSRIQPALAAIESGVESVRKALEQVDAVLADAIEVADRALRGVEGAKNTLAGMVPSPQTTAALTNQVKRDLLQQTYTLQSAILAPVHGVHNRVRGLFTQAFDQAWDEFNSTIQTVQSKVDDLFQNVRTQWTNLLDTLRKDVLSALEGVIQTVRDVIGQAKLVYMDAATVIRPDQLGSFLGLASGLAAIRATSEARGTSWSQLSAGEKSRWENRIGWDETRRPYDQVHQGTAQAYDNDTSIEDHTDSVDAVDKWLEGGGTPPAGTGMGTGGVLAEWGANISEGRGSIQTSKVGPNDLQVDEFKLRIRAQLGDGEDPAFKADVVGMTINRHGKYHVYGRDIETSIVKKDLSADVDVLINTSEPRFEGGLTVYQMSVEQVDIAEAGVAVGVGANVLYVGVKFDGILSTGGGKFGVGGVVLAGKLDPDSPVLKHHFPEAMDRVNQVPSGSPQPYAGMYLSAHLDVPLSTVTGVQLGCVLSLNVGGRLGLWYFQTARPNQVQGSPPFTFGIKVGGYSYGTVVCAIDARGEITVTFSYSGTIDSGAKPTGTVTVKGTTWVAAGVGKCEPGTWKDWDKHFWNDGWCVQAGAYAEVTGTGELPGPKNMQVSPNVEADVEGPW
jgi:hypothetical protein